MVELIALTMLVGAVVSMIGLTLLLAEAFQEGIWWGVGVFVAAPIVGTAFAFRFWRKGGMPFIVMVIGFAIVIFGLTLVNYLSVELTG
jgi:hypothetical protein